MPEQDNKMLEWALWYARERQWPVFPVTPGAKKPPLTKNGLLDATLDEKQIRAWWKKWPNANVAIRTGVGCFVVDQDPGGEATWERIVHEHGRPRDTLEAITPRGGRHRFYLEPEQAEIPTRAPARDDWKGIDVRGVGGYALVHPSVVMVNGKPRRYQWDGAKGENDVVAPADAWLLDALLNHRNGAGDKPPFQLPDKMFQSEKERHKGLLSFGGAMRAKGCDEAEILAALLVVNEKRCVPPYDRKHIEELAHWIATKPPGPAHQPAPTVDPVELPQGLSVREVKALTVPSPGILVEGLLPERGLALFTGGQKMGKTILAAQAAIAVAGGHPLLDYYRIEKTGPVVIIETDDPAGDASFKDLWVKWDVPDGLPATLYTRAPFQLGEEFLGWIEAVIAAAKPVLVVLDSYLSLRPMRSKGGDVVHIEKQEIAQLDALAKRLGTLILLLHHESTTSKASSLLDWDSRGAGTFAITAAAESQLSISRFRDLDGSTARLVRSRGRHLAERMMTIAYDVNLGNFTHILDGPAAPHYPLILEMRRNISAATFTATELQEATGVSRAAAFRQLTALRNAGVLLRERFNEYRFAAPILSMPL